MSLIIETGSGTDATAESYVSASDATAYHSAQGNSAWAGTDAVKESALRRAVAYLDGYYRGRWKGCMCYPAMQPLAWPRYGVLIGDDMTSSMAYYAAYLAADVIPQRVKNAQCELALLEIVAPGALSPALGSSVRREKVDVLETEYFAGSKPGAMEYPAIDALLSDYLMPLNSCNTVRG